MLQVKTAGKSGESANTGPTGGETTNQGSLFDVLSFSSYDFLKVGKCFDFGAKTSGVLVPREVGML